MIITIILYLFSYFIVLLGLFISLKHINKKYVRHCAYIFGGKIKNYLNNLKNKVLINYLKKYIIPYTFEQLLFFCELFAGFSEGVIGLETSIIEPIIEPIIEQKIIETHDAEQQTEIEPIEPIEPNEPNEPIIESIIEPNESIIEPIIEPIKKIISKDQCTQTFTENSNFMESKATSNKVPNKSTSLSNGQNINKPIKKIIGILKKPEPNARTIIDIQNDYLSDATEMSEDETIDEELLKKMSYLKKGIGKPVKKQNHNAFLEDDESSYNGNSSDNETKGGYSLSDYKYNDDSLSFDSKSANTFDTFDKPINNKFNKLNNKSFEQQSSKGKKIFVSIKKR
jgi:hypothetical protein